VLVIDMISLLFSMAWENLDIDRSYPIVSLPNVD